VIDELFNNREAALLRQLSKVVSLGLRVLVQGRNA
jgi:hypothetical protein